MRILKSESGQAAVFAAVFMSLAMLGFLAFAIDVGYLFHEKRQAQAAADAAAVAAAEEMTAAGSTTVTPAARTAANVAATANGFNTGQAANPAVVTLTPLTSGIYSSAGSGSVPSVWLTATVSQPVPTFFFNAFRKGASGTMSIEAAGVAGVSAASPTCICLLHGSGMDLNMSNNAQLNANSCGVESDSSSSNAIGVVGSSSVCGSSVQAVSTNWNNSNNINNNGSICTAAQKIQGAPACDPVLTVPTLPTGITCYNNPINGYVLAANSQNSNNYNGNYTLPFQNVKEMNNGQPVSVPNEVATSGAICYNSLNLSNAASVTFTSGYTYFIEGDFTTGGGAPVTGSGVTFVITGNIDIANGVKVTLSAPSSSGVPGTLFYATGSTATIEGGSNSALSGVVYAPNANITLDNGTGTTTNMDIVAQTLNMSGGAALNSFATPVLSGSGTGAAKLSQ